MLYGDSGAGKSSLVNAGLIDEATHKGFQPERIRVQPSAEQELVVERIATDDTGTRFLPSLFAQQDESGPHLVFSTADFEERLRAGCSSTRPLLIFDQFEELITLFEEADQADLQRRIVELLTALLRDDALPVKMLFVFREDYLARVKQILTAVPELVDQSLRLTAPGANELDTIIRGPFERYPGVFARELSPELTERLRAKLANRFGSGRVSLSEVQTVCLRLWQSEDPDALLETREVQGILEDYLGEELERFPDDLRYAAVALLSQMVTSAGTRSVVSAEDLVERVREEEMIPPEQLKLALERLESDSKLVRREHRRDLYLYEITSEFLVPWISRRRDELVSARRTKRQRRRRLVFGSLAGTIVLSAVLGSLGVWALRQRSDARKAEDLASSLALAYSSRAQLASRPDVSLLLGLAGWGLSDRIETRSAMIDALEVVHSSRVAAIFRGHEGPVSSIAVSLDGRMLASGGADGTIRFWDVAAREPIGPPLDATARVSSIAFSNDGRTLASGGADGTVRVWDVQQRKIVSRPLIDQPGAIVSLAFSPAARLLAAGTRNGRVWLLDLDAKEGTQASLLTRHRSRVMVAFSANGDVLATGGGSMVKLWNVRTPDEPRGKPLGGFENVQAIALSADASKLASADSDGTVKLWNVRARRSQRLSGPTPASQRSFETSGGPTKKAPQIRSVAFSPDQRTLAVGGDRKIRLWNVAARKPRPFAPALAGHGGPIQGVAFSPDGERLASGSVDGTIRLWNIGARSRFVEPLGKHLGDAWAVAFIPGRGKTLLAADSHGTIRIWDADRRKQVRPPLRGHTGDVIAIALSSDGRTAATGGEDGTVRLWNLRTHKPLGEPLQNKGPVWAVALTADGRTVAAGGPDDAIRLWDARTHKPLGRRVCRCNSVRSLAFSPDGSTLVSAGFDGTLRFWKPKGLKQVGRPLRGGKDLSAVFDVAFGPGGQVLASANDDGTIRLWSVRTRKQLGEPLRAHTSFVYDLAFNPDGSMLASASKDGTVRLWNLKERKQLGRPIRAHTSAVHSVAFSDDGATFASGGCAVGGFFRCDGSVRLWEGILWRDREDLQANVCGLVIGRLTPEEWREFAPSIRPRATCP